MHSTSAVAGHERFTVCRKAVVQELIKPARVVARGEGKWFIDFGRACFGGLELVLDKPEAGRKVTARLGEKLAAPEEIDRQPGGSVRYLEAAVVLAAGRSVYRLELGEKDGRLMPDAVGPVMPFRYAELEGLPTGLGEKELRNGAVRQVMAFYPFDDGAADFSCADNQLNAIWEMCKHTIKATSFGGVFVDGDRERKPYEADAYINQLGWYCCTTDVTLPRHTHEYLMLHPTWPTEWILFSVLIAWEDYVYTGDDASLRAFYDDLKAKTLQALARDDGLISTVKPAVSESVLASIYLQEKLQDIVDWPWAERDGCDTRPVNTVVNAFHCRALTLMARIAEVVGHLQDAAVFRTAARRATDSLNEKLVDRVTGLYVDGEGSTHSSLHANLLPLAFGLVPAERKERVLAFIEGRGMACSVYAAQFLMDVLFDHQRGDAALALMTAPGNRSWRHMVEDVGTTLALEAWDNQYKPNQDWNHAWGAAPANVLPRKVLGIEPLEPGMSRVLIWPRAGKLAWAKGKIPTVKGTIAVEWERTGADGFRMEIELPPGIVARVGLPRLGGTVEVDVDGQEKKGEERDGAVFVEIVDAGRHRCELRTR